VTFHGLYTYVRNRQTSQQKWKLKGKKDEEINVDGIRWGANENKINVHE
jgi:hypothetical protein